MARQHTGDSTQTASTLAATTFNKPRRAFLKSVAVASAVAAAADAAQAAGAAIRKISIADLDLRYVLQGWGKPQKDRSVGGNPLRIGSKTFSHGLGTHATSAMFIALHKQAQLFSSWVGVDREIGPQRWRHGQVIFEVKVDHKLRAKSPVMKPGDEPYHIAVDLAGAKLLQLFVKPVANDVGADNADWADAVITMAPGATMMPQTLPLGDTSMPEIASGDTPLPDFHGARVVGCTPGRPFLFKVPYTGQEPVKIKADNLPAGLILSQDGIITGEVQQAGEYVVTLTASNDLGQATRKLTIIAGEHKLAQTPAMGWNSWNAFDVQVNAKHVRDTADAMVASGLAAKGFNYVNIDDTWEGPRDAKGNITTNKKFPDMKALVDYVHSKGLRFGIYSSPGPKTCAGYPACYQHEQQDADTYAKWGVDYLKYDWCSYGSVATGAGVERFIKPYATMRTALDKINRDIFYSLCQYGMGDVWKWAAGAPVYGNSWRICGDINDSWRSLVNNGFKSDAPLARYAGPGHWNDPDMMLVGYGKFEDGPLHNSHLTPWQQLTHVTLWCMVAAPLLLGCDLTRLDKFTTDLITNTEVLDVNQDPLGRQAQPVRIDTGRSLQVWARPLFDGTFAVALFNLSYQKRKVSLLWADLAKVAPAGQSAPVGSQPVRDLWKRKDLGSHDGFAAMVPSHGAVMIKVGKPVEG
ncbi:MAG: alpha-galactosidase [Phycisphaerales bacterium]|nr:alpha-galactosidase [Phycisphaerales bacterium]